MSPDAGWPWSVLGLPAIPPETSDIRRAYAKALKQIDQSKDIEGFANLRAAYVRGLAIREGRTAQNSAKRARKAQAAAQNMPTIDLDIEPPAPLPPTAEQIAAQAKDAALGDLLTHLATPHLVANVGQRIIDTLANPLSHDPDCAPRIRLAIASLLRGSIVSDEYNEPALAPEISAETLLALDTRFGWLNDYAAFRRDFWNDSGMQHIMVTRAYDKISVHKTIPQNGRGGILSAVCKIFHVSQGLLWVVYFSALRALTNYQIQESNNDERSWPMVISFLAALTPGAIVLVYVARSIFRDLRKLPRKLLHWLTRWQVRINNFLTETRRPKR